MKKYVYLLSVIFLFTISCQQKPTVVTSEAPIMNEASSASVQKWLQSLLKEEPVILDVRSTFDFNLSHVPSAVNVRWEDFAQQDPHSRGVLDPDLFALARRLALVGVSPDSKVLVLGKGLQGQGEEGRVAWTLRVLGVKNIYTLNHTELRSLRVQETPSVQNKPMWKPEVDETLMVDVKVFKNMVTGSIPRRAFSSKSRQQALQLPAGAANKISTANIMGLSMEEALKKLVVIDARSAELFSTENLKQKKNVVVPVVNIPWKHFYSERGIVSEAAVAKLTENKIDKDSVIFVISNQGLESGAVTFALRSLGYSRSANFAGGYEQWNVSK